MMRLGFSPCPNDTFIFYAIANKKIDTSGLDFEPLVKDIETLNHLAMKRAVDITKVSSYAFHYLHDDYHFLRSGGAFGRGCGPLLVVRSQVSGVRNSEIKRIAIPGELTTAFLLLKLYLSSTPKPKLQNPNFIAMPFYEIMGSVRDGKADAGVIIHESRFTYHEYGLAAIVDLGDWWEKETGLPVPLGGIIAKKHLGMNTIRTIEYLIKTSVEYSLQHREEAFVYIKRHSQELSDDVILKHISLYINDYTFDMGDDGEAALNELLKRAETEHQ